MRTSENFWSSTIPSSPDGVSPACLDVEKLVGYGNGKRSISRPVSLRVPRRGTYPCRCKVRAVTKFREPCARFHSSVPSEHGFAQMRDNLFWVGFASFGGLSKFSNLFILLRQKNGGPSPEHYLIIVLYYPCRGTTSDKVNATDFTKILQRRRVGSGAARRPE